MEGLAFPHALNNVLEIGGIEGIMADKSDIFLYWGSGSSPSWRPMIVLAEKGKWKDGMNKLLNFSKGEHKQSDYMALNPRGQVPTFRDGNVVINESAAICLYLEDKYSDDKKKLIPTDLNKKAIVFQRMFESQNVISNILDPLLIYRFRTKKEEWDNAVLKEGEKKAKEELDRWNTILSGTKYLCGDDFTMADVYFYPYIALFVRTGATLSGFTNLKRYYDMVSERPSVKATWPPHWKESDGPDFLKDL